MFVVQQRVLSLPLKEHAQTLAERVREGYILAEFNAESLERQLRVLQMNSRTADARRIRSDFAAASDALSEKAMFSVHSTGKSRRVEDTRRDVFYADAGLQLMAREVPVYVRTLKDTVRVSSALARLQLDVAIRVGGSGYLSTRTVSCIGSHVRTHEVHFGNYVVETAGASLQGIVPESSPGVPAPVLTIARGAHLGADETQLVAMIGERPKSYGFLVEIGLNQGREDVGNALVNALGYGRIESDDGHIVLLNKNWHLYDVGLCGPKAAYVVPRSQRAARALDPTVKECVRNALRENKSVPKN